MLITGNLKNDLVTSVVSNKCVFKFCILLGFGALVGSLPLSLPQFTLGTTSKDGCYKTTGLASRVLRSPPTLPWLPLHPLALLCTFMLWPEGWRTTFWFNAGEELL